MEQEIAVVEPKGLVPMSSATITDTEIDRMFRIAKALAMSGMFKDATQAEQAFAKILLGRDLGLSPTQAMTGIHIVEGKPEVAAVTLASFVKKLPGKDYLVTEHTDEVCSIDFYEGGERIGTSRFTIEDAKQAGLVRNSRTGQPGNYSKYPRNMLFARAMSNGVKWFVPDATGGVPVYHEGEVEVEPKLLNGAPVDRPEVKDAPEVEWGEDPEVAMRVKLMVDIANGLRPNYLRPAKLALNLNGKTDEERLDFIRGVEKFIVDNGGELPDPPVEGTVVDEGVE